MVLGWWERKPLLIGHCNESGGRANAHDLDLGINAPVEFVAFEGKGNIPWRAGQSFFCAPEVDGLDGPASGAKIEPQMPFLENSWGARRCYPASGEDGLGITHSVRLEQFLHIEQRE